MTQEEQTALKYQVLEQLKDFRDYLTKKIPTAQAEWQVKVEAITNQIGVERKQNEAQINNLLAQLQDTKALLNVANEQLTFYKNAYEVCSKAGKRSAGCWFKKIISFGGWKCH